MASLELIVVIWKHHYYCINRVAIWRQGFSQWSRELESNCLETLPIQTKVCWSQKFALVCCQFKGGKQEEWCDRQLHRCRGEVSQESRRPSPVPFPASEVGGLARNLDTVASLSSGTPGLLLPTTTRSAPPSPLGLPPRLVGPRRLPRPGPTAPTLGQHTAQYCH